MMEVRKAIQGLRESVERIRGESQERKVEILMEEDEEEDGEERRGRSRTRRGSVRE